MSCWSQHQLFLLRSVGSVVRQKNDREDEGVCHGVQDGGNTGIGVRGRDMGVE